MSEQAIFTIKSIGLSTVNRRKPQTLEVAAKHNKREPSKSHKWLVENEEIDEAKTGQNYCIAGAPDAAGVVALQLQRLTENPPKRDRVDYCQALEAVSSLQANTVIDVRQYFGDYVAWCCEWFGAENILSADVHLDQSHPHCHVLITPIKDGQWRGGNLWFLGLGGSTRKGGRMACSMFSHPAPPVLLKTARVGFKFRHGKQP